MALTIAGAVQDRATWEPIKERLNPNTPGRLRRTGMRSAAKPA